MVRYSYHHEQLDLLMLFTSAFDDCLLYRYDANTRLPKSKIDVRYIHGPKQKVIYDIVSKQKNLTLPVVSIEQTNLARDTDRIMHKNQNIYRPTSNNSGKIPMPVPVTMNLKISIIAKYKEDIDQIVQNFVTVANPYFVVSWKVPSAFKLDFIDELRTQIEWDGSISYSTPSNMAAEDKYRITGDTSFTIKGWLFQSTDNSEALIYEINTNFIASDLTSRILSYDDYPSLSGAYAENEMISVSAYPQFTNLYFNSTGDIVPIRENIEIKTMNENKFTILGKRFSFNNNWYLSSGNPSLFSGYEKITTAKFPTISAYRLPYEYVSVADDNMAVITLPPNSLSASGRFTFVTSNSAGWTSWNTVINTDITH